MSEAEAYARASDTIRLAMGTETVRGGGRGYRTVRRADDDPLAYTVAVEAIMSICRTARAEARREALEEAARVAAAGKPTGGDR